MLPILTSLILPVRNQRRSVAVLTFNLAAASSSAKRFKLHYLTDIARKRVDDNLGHQEHASGKRDNALA